MYIRIFSKRNKSYVKLVESVREGSKVRQRHIAYLGCVQTDSEQLLKLAESIKRHCNPSQYLFGGGTIIKASEYGRVLLCEKLFDESGILQFIEQKIKKTKRQYVSLAHIKAMIYNRLCDPRSKYSILRWLEDVHMPGIEVPEEITEDHQKYFADVCYRNMDFLLPFKEQIEELLYAKVKTLFDEVEVVMYDLTSTYFEGDGPAELAEFGYSRDGKKGNRQIMIGVVLVNGFPVGHEIFRGNMTDSKTLKQIVEKLKTRYKIKRIVFVADAGLITEENTKYLEENGYEYILCCKRRRSLDWMKMFAEWEKTAKSIKKENDPSQVIQWIEKKQEGKRFILCESKQRKYHEIEMRESIMNIVRIKLQRLEEIVKRGKLKNRDLIIKRTEKILSRKRAHWYFGYTVERGKFTWEENEEKLRREKFVEGKFFLQTNNKDMKSEAIIEAYKELWKIERGFRTLKNFIEVRPVFHWKSRRVRAHVFICTLSQFLERLLQHKINNARDNGMSAQKALYSMRSLKLAKVQEDGSVVDKLTTPGPVQKSILKMVNGTENINL